MKQLNKESLAETLKVLGGQVTKKDRYQACIDLGRGGIPVDIKTIDGYLKGEDGVRNTEFGNCLIEYFQSMGYQPNTAA